MCYLFAIHPTYYSVFCSSAVQCTMWHAIFYLDNRVATEDCTITLPARPHGLGALNNTCSLHYAERLTCTIACGGISSIRLLSHNAGFTNIFLFQSFLPSVFYDKMIFSPLKQRSSTVALVVRPAGQMDCIVYQNHIVWMKSHRLKTLDEHRSAPG